MIKIDAEGGQIPSRAVQEEVVLKRQRMLAEREFVSMKLKQLKIPPAAAQN